MDVIKLHAIFERVTAESEIYIQRKDSKGFIRAVWAAAAKEIPFLKEFIDLYETPGFKTNDQRLRLQKFIPVKEGIDKLLVILVDAAMLDTPLAYNAMAEKLKNFADENGMTK